MRSSLHPALCLLLLLGVTSPGRAQAAGTPGEPTRNGLEVIVLGSGGPGAEGRASSSYLVVLSGEPRILVDAGSGAFVRLGETHLSLAALDTVLLTHLHVDHAAELPGIVKARAVSTGAPIHFDIVGPAGREAHGDAAFFPATSRFIELLFGAHGAFAYLKDFAAPVSFTVTDLPGSNSELAEPRSVGRSGELVIRAVGGHHGDAPALIYRIEYRGRSVVFSGDIDPQGLPGLERIAQGAQLLIAHAVVLDPPGSPQVLYTLHSPPSAIGEAAARAHVGALVLSHLSPAVEMDRAAVSASIARHYHGPVTFASDGMRLTPR
jgi:ribonuclease BN (tRNA processing enzyme)